MFIIVFILFYLAIVKKFEPLLVNCQVGFGGLLANIPIANMTGENGFLGII